MSDYIELTLDIFDEPDQRVSVRKTLTAEDLIGEIVHEFEDIADDNPGGFALTSKESGKRLEASQTLRDQGIQDGDTLEFGWARGQFATGRQALTAGAKAVLTVVGKEARFPLTWQPAIIGRSDSDPRHAELLAINVEWLPNARRVSRRQAQITERNGKFFLESLSDNNTTYVNGAAVPLGTRQALNHGDRIQLGRSQIELAVALS